MPADRAEARPSATAEPLHHLLNRSPAERCREYRYRFGQSMVFGLPVIALAAFGPSLGGPEASRWTGLLQLLLAGWIIYVAALAMLVDATLRRRLTADAIAAGLSLALYLAGAAGVIFLFATGRSLHQRWGFAAEVMILCAWNGARWLRYQRRSDLGPHV